MLLGWRSSKNKHERNAFFENYLQKLDRDVDGGPADAALLDLALGGKDLSDRAGNDAAVGGIPDHGVRLSAVRLPHEIAQKRHESVRSAFEKVQAARGPRRFSRAGRT